MVLDTHGHLLPFSYPDSAASGRELQGLRTYKDIGGIARRATLVKRIRAEQKARGVETWLVDAGDYSDGTPFDFTVCLTPFLYSDVITDTSVLAFYIGNTDYLFSATGGVGFQAAWAGLAR